ncbi:MAG: FAD:protein FMN transferase, partial [Acidobacteriota bacterium]
METAPAGDAVRLAMEAFGTVVEIEVRDLPEDRTRQAIRDAMVELHRLSLLTSADAEVAGGAGRIEAAAGREIEADPAYGELLLSGLRYCIWSGGAHGPLGGRLYGLWGGAERPDPYTLREALPTAACDRLEILSREPMRVRLAPQTILDTRGMERGFAADLAVEVLQEHSVANAVVEVGSVVRALGPGPDGRGWPITVPGASGSREILDEIYLHDQSLAVLSVPPGADERRPIDQRKG